MRNDIRNTTTAILLAILQQRLDEPISIRCEKGRGAAMLAAVRVKLARERVAAHGRRIKFVDFMLCELETRTYSSCDIVTVVRTVSRETFITETSIIETALLGASHRDRHAIVNMIERNDTNGYLKGQAAPERWANKPTAEFDAIGFANQFKKPTAISEASRVFAELGKALGTANDSGEASAQADDDFTALDEAQSVDLTDADFDFEPKPPSDFVEPATDRANEAHEPTDADFVREACDAIRREVLDQYGHGSSGQAPNTGSTSGFNAGSEVGAAGRNTSQDHVQSASVHGVHLPVQNQSKTNHPVGGFAARFGRRKG